MIISQDLRLAWRQMVGAEKIVSRFKTEKGEIEIGLRMVDNKPSYYSCETSADGKRRELPGKIQERLVEGTDFVIQHNSFRGHRPGANNPIFKDGEDPAPKPGIADCRIACHDAKKNLSMLVRDTAGQVRLENGRYNIYPNLFPIEEEGHFLYIPVERDNGVETLRHIPQRMTKGALVDMVNIAKNTKEAITFFNSLHAGASVDHFHIQQVFYRKKLKDEHETPLRNGVHALENAAVTRHGGQLFLRDYPSGGMVFDFNETEALWNEVNKAQERKFEGQDDPVPFNLISIGERSYFIPRLKEFERVKEFSNTLASFENVGVIVVEDEATFRNTQGHNVRKAYGKQAYSPDEIIAGYPPKKTSTR